MGVDDILWIACFPSLYLHLMVKKKKTEKDKMVTFVSNHMCNLSDCARLNHYAFQFSFGSPDDNSDFRGSKPAHMTMETDYEYLTATLTLRDDWFHKQWHEGDLLIPKPAKSGLSGLVRGS